MSALLFPQAPAVRRAVGQAARAVATGHNRRLHLHAERLCSRLAICNDTTQIAHNAARRQLSTTAARFVDRPVTRSDDTQVDAVVVSREQALAELASCASDAAAAYRLVCAMRERGLLQNKAGAATHSVLLDTKVTLGLVRVLEQQHVWEDCLNCLNLVLNMRPDLLGKEYTDKRFTQIGGASLKDTDPAVLHALANAVLSRRFVALPERRLAGLTAVQILCDGGISPLDPALGSAYIRALGFVSDKKSLGKALQALSRQARTPNMQYEIALAHARCMQPAAALGALAKTTGLTKEQRIEARLAVALSLADCADMDGAYEQFESLRNDETLWTSDQATYDQLVSVRITELHILYASMMSMLPRRPFTENFHTHASRGHSRVFTAQYAERISQLLKETIACLRKDLDRERWRLFGVDRLVFHCECLAFAMTPATPHLKPDISIGVLKKRLHSLERGMAQQLDRAAEGEAQLSAYVAEPGMSSLRHFLWAIALATNIPQGKRLGIIQTELDHAKQRVPGFVLSVAELEPALVAALPPNVWSMALKGNFKAEAAFMLSDELMNSPGLISMHPYTEQLLDMAQVAWRQISSDNRLFPLCIWIAAAQGNHQMAKHFVDEACQVAQVRVLPGSLALVNARDRTFYEQMFAAMSTSKRCAALAITKLRPAMRRQRMPVALGPRVATTLLSCCVRIGNLPIATDAVATLEALPDYAVPPKILELLMRVCAVSGQTDKALSIFQHLNYGAKHTQVNEPSFVLLMVHLGLMRSSLARAEHVFDVWMQIMGHQGRISAALVEFWSLLRPSIDSQSGRNPLLPASGVSVAQALEAVGIPRSSPGAMSDKHFLRDWEYIMVMELVAAYISAGHSHRVAAWEKCILDAIHAKHIHLGPTLIASTSRVQRQHLRRGGWDAIQACLDFVVAIDKNSAVGLFRKNSHYMNQAPILSAISELMRKDAGGSMAAQIKGHLEERKALHIFDKINKLE
ncbi:hypothetical protein GGF42_001609 [Coemansia sp. RSA 2424]|nr:hypothetical protein GGF42_001609 [Coemansia sp. RSA 2424]